VLTRSLTQRGYAVTVAHGMEAALQMIRSRGFNHAILDLNLDGQSSLELIPALTVTNAKIRILILTGYASIATAVEAIKLGAHNYLAKPADAEEILSALTRRETALESSSSHQEPMSVRRLEWEHIQKVLLENDGNISATARQLKMHRRTLQRKLQKRPVSR
jgi:two-component system response regulator RegA